MLMQLLTGGLMIAVTTAIHAGFMAMGIGMLLRWHPVRPGSGMARATAAVAAFVVVMFAAAIIEIWCWSALFLYVGAFDNVEPAVYFTTVSYTTLGYGDVTLGPDHRQLAAVCAANGIIMFGWTTALVFAVVQRVYAPMFARANG